MTIDGRPAVALADLKLALLALDQLGVRYSGPCRWCHKPSCDCQEWYLVRFIRDHDDLLRELLGTFNLRSTVAQRIAEAIAAQRDEIFNSDDPTYELNIKLDMADVKAMLQGLQGG